MVRLVGFAGLLLGGLATLIGNWSQEQQMKETVREEVDKALALKEGNEEE